jgi:hypothetical protein
MPGPRFMWMARLAGEPTGICIGFARLPIVETICSHYCKLRKNHNYFRLTTTSAQPPPHHNNLRALFHGGHRSWPLAHILGGRANQLGLALLLKDVS